MENLSVDIPWLKNQFTNIMDIGTDIDTSIAPLMKVLIFAMTPPMCEYHFQSFIMKMF